MYDEFPHIEEQFRTALDESLQPRSPELLYEIVAVGAARRLARPRRRMRRRVDEVLAEAERAGGEVVKPARRASWGGYSGYFADPEGYLWEVATGATQLPVSE